VIDMMYFDDLERVQLGEGEQRIAEHELGKSIHEVKLFYGTWMDLVKHTQRMAAAAPDLLAACEAALEQLPYEDGNAARMCREAIAKARGA
jgi:hypothetical protein